MQDGTPIRTRSIDGPGIWVSCIRGKERQTVGELYDLFESVSSCHAVSYIMATISNQSPSLPTSYGQRLPMSPTVTPVTIRIKAQRIWRNNFRRNLPPSSVHVKSRCSVSGTPLA